MNSKCSLWVWLALAIVVAAGMGGRWVSADHLSNPGHNTGRRFSGDEIAYMALGDRIWKEGRYDTQGLAKRLDLDPQKVHIAKYLEAPLFKHPPLYPFLVGMSRQLFWKIYGSSIYPSLLMGAVGLFAMFWLAREAKLPPEWSLLAVFLLAVDPVHWISSSRVWLDSTLVAFIILAAAAQLRALTHARWYLAMGIFWGLAFLTKYTAFAGWGFACAIALLDPATRKNRWFWRGQAVAVLLFLPWLALRFRFEGVNVFLFWRSEVEDWRTLARMSRWVAALPAAAFAAWLWSYYSEKKAFKAWTSGPNVLAWGSALFIAGVLIAGKAADFGAAPWAGWAPNKLAHSPRDFYLTHPVLLDPVCWWGLAGLLAGVRDSRWDLVRAVWAGLFLFLTAWGNFQSRYGLPLIPFQLLLAVAILGPALQNGKSAALVRALAVCWVGLSCARSLWIMANFGIENQFFYF